MHMWKYLVDFEGVWSGLVESVQFVFSSSIPSDIVTLTQPPYLTPGWRTGTRPQLLDCIINYKVRGCEGVIPTGILLATA